MSIIHDALKKTQQMMTKTTPQPPAGEPEPEGQPPQTEAPASGTLPANPGKPNKIIPVINILLGLILCIILIRVLTGKKQPPAPKPSTAKQEIKETRPALQPAAQKKPAAPAPAPAMPRTSETISLPDSLTLSGTMVLDDKQVALINGEIYEVGDSLAGGVIQSIDIKKVEILINGQTAVLNSR